MYARIYSKKLCIWNLFIGQLNYVFWNKGDNAPLYVLDSIVRIFPKQGGFNSTIILKYEVTSKSFCVSISLQQFDSCIF